MFCPKCTEGTVWQDSTPVADHPTSFGAIIHLSDAHLRFSRHDWITNPSTDLWLNDITSLHHVQDHLWLFVYTYVYRDVVNLCKSCSK